MKRLLLISSVTVAVTLSLGGCAAPPPPRAPSASPAPSTSPAGPASRLVELPGAPSDGEPREVRVLVDDPALKLVSITLRGGAALPTHQSEVPVTILALSGSGVVLVGAERLRLDPAHAVVLGANVAHAVTPDPDTSLVLLVHHLGGGAEHHP